MSCFPAKVMATLVLLLLVGGIDIPATSVSLPYGGRKSLSLDGSTKTIPKLQGSSEGLDISGRKIVSFQSLRKGPSPPPPPPPSRSPIQKPTGAGRYNRDQDGDHNGDHNRYKWIMPEPKPKSTDRKPEPVPEPVPEPEPEPTPPPQIL